MLLKTTLSHSVLIINRQQREPISKIGSRCLKTTNIYSSAMNYKERYTRVMNRLAIIALLLFIATHLVAQIPALERVEPSNWWVGMKNAKLQLLVHGNKIANRKVQLSYPGVRLIKTNKVSNPNYLFLDVEISAATKPGKFNIQFTEIGKPLLTYSYQLNARNTSASRCQGVTSKDLIYLIMPDRFANGDITNDRVAGMKDTSLNRSVLTARHGGDLQGIINHLDYLKDLGVTAIWLTPEIENDQQYTSYHGYAVTDHYKIDPRYGSNELYKTYVEKCHAKGLKVIKDIVHNHIGSAHWTMQDMPMKDWVHQWPKYTNTNFKDHAVMDPYAAAADKKIMVDGWFDGHMPDMNQSNEFVQNYLTQNNIWWIEYAGIDGLRLDTYPYNDLSYMSTWAAAIKAEFPRLGIFGETLVASVVNQAFFTEGKTVNQSIDTHLPGITDAQVKDAIYDVLNVKSDGVVNGVNRLYTTLANDFVYKDPSRNVVFLDNHDMSRLYSVVGEDFDKFKSAVAMLLTTRGIPEIYYGTEFLMKNFSNPDGLVRLDVRGGWQGDSSDIFTEKGRTAKENEAYNFVKKLANYRKNNPVLHDGKLMQYVPVKGIYIFFRYNSEKTLMVIVNSNEKEEVLEMDRFSERLNGFAKGVNVITGNAVNSLDKINIAAKETLVIELSK